MAQVVKTAAGVLAIGVGTFYTKAYFDVLSAQRSCEAVRGKVRNGEDTLKLNELKIKEYTKKIDALDEEGRVCLKEQDDLRRNIEIITRRIRELANELTEKQTKWTEVQKETKSLYGKIIGLRSQNDALVDEIKAAVVTLEAAEIDAIKAKDFMNPVNYTWVQAFHGKK